MQSNFNDFNHVKLLGQVGTPYMKSRTCGKNFICKGVNGNSKQKWGALKYFVYKKILKWGLGGANRGVLIKPLIFDI